MRSFPTARGPAFRGVAIALVLAVAGGTAVAAPDDATDPLLKLLADKGLLVDNGVLVDTGLRVEPAPAVAPDARPTTLLRQVHDRASD